MVKANRGSGGVDGQSLEGFAAQLDQQLDRLHRELKEAVYQPQPPNNNWCLPPHPDGSTDAVHQFGCQFGRITNTQIDARNLEFGLKLGF